MHLAVGAALAMALFTPQMAVAFDIEGTWTTRTDATVCEVGYDSPNHAIHIADGRFYGVENTCRMTNPVAIRGMDAMLYDMVCSGEGMEWSYRAFFARSEQGHLTMVSNGYPQMMQRCMGRVTLP